MYMCYPTPEHPNIWLSAVAQHQILTVGVTALSETKWVKWIKWSMPDGFVSRDILTRWGCAESFSPLQTYGKEYVKCCQDKMEVSFALSLQSSGSNLKGLFVELFRVLWALNLRGRWLRRHWEGAERTLNASWYSERNLISDISLLVSYQARQDVYMPISILLLARPPRSYHGQFISGCATRIEVTPYNPVGEYPLLFSSWLANLSSRAFQSSSPFFSFVFSIPSHSSTFTRTKCRVPTLNSAFQR